MTGLPDVGATRGVQVTFDCANPAGLAEFWAAVLGYVVQPPPDGFASWEEALRAFGVPTSEWNSRSAVVDPDGYRPRVFFQRVPEPKSVKNRLHVDVRVGGTGADRMERLEAEADRLVALGASVLRRVQPDGPMETGFITMADPEGNEFCLD